MGKLVIYELDEARTLQLKSDRDRMAAFLDKVIKSYPPKMIVVVLNDWIRNAKEYAGVGDRRPFGVEFLYSESLDDAMIRSNTSHGHCNVVYGLNANQIASLRRFFEDERYVEWRTCIDPHINDGDFGCPPCEQLNCSLLVEAVGNVAQACGNALYFSHDAAEAYFYKNS